MTALTITTTAIVPVAVPTLGTARTPVYVHGPALSAITAGQSVYEDTSTSPPSFGLFDADSATAAVRTLKGLCICGAVAAGQVIAVQIAGQCAFGAILTKGLIYTGTATAGGVGPSADQTTGWYMGQLGHALSTSILDIVPYSSGVAI